MEEQEIKEHLKDYLLSRGIDIKKNMVCPNPDHKDENPSAKFYEDSNTIYCFGCGKHYDIFDLIGFEYGLNDKDAYKKGFELYDNKPIKHKNCDFSEKKVVENTKEEQNLSKDFEKWHKALLESESAKEYLASRKITDLSINKFNLGYNADKNTIIIPTSEYSYNSRTITDKHFYKQGASNLFNKSALSNDKTYCIITEGEFDCMSFVECGCNAIGLGGVGQTNKLLSEQLPQSKTYLLALDNDKAGNDCMVKLEEEFTKRNLSFKRLDFGSPYKDPNEALTSDFDRFLTICERVKKEFEIKKEQNMEKQNKKEEYFKENALNKLAEFEEYVEYTKNVKAFDTGFDKLDEYLGGGLMPGLTTLLAIPGIGKSTFALQIADYVAQTGRDVLIFALEMSRNELIAKSLSRISFENEKSGCTPQPSNNFLFGYNQVTLSEKELEYMQACKEEYKKFAEHIYIVESNAAMNVIEIGNRIKRHIEIMGNTPLVIIDYLQIIKPLKDNITDKQNIDNIVLELKVLSRELKACILTISSVNRESYEQCLGLSSAKESGEIEFTSNVILGLQHEPKRDKNGKLTTKQDDINSRDNDILFLHLRILKNRFGVNNKTVMLKFYPKNCKFVDTEAEQVNQAFESKTREKDKQARRNLTSEKPSESVRNMFKDRTENVF